MRPYHASHRNADYLSVQLSNAPGAIRTHGPRIRKWMRDIT